MPAESWKQARSNVYKEAREMEGLVKFYDYSDQHNSKSTDEMLRTLFVEKLRKLKARLFDVIEMSYELHQDDTSKKLQRVMDDVDILSDEVKVSRGEFNGLTQAFIEKLIRHDYEMMGGMEELRETLDKAFKKAKNGEKVATTGMKKQVSELVRVFKEREVIANMREVSMEKAYKDLSEDIRQKV